MKKLLLTILALSALVTAKADVIAQWDFNTQPREAYDGDETTGTFNPFIGSGSLTNIGGPTNQFGSVAGGDTSDQWIADNSQLRIGSQKINNVNVGTFPGAASKNKTAGFQFLNSTAGYENIQVSWDHENSGSASRYWRAQYTTDGTTWNDYVVILNTNGTAWQHYSVDLGGFPGVRDNPDFGFRLVSEFESTATGTGTAGYVGNAGNYSTVGTLWIDMVVMSGVPLTGNTAPTISSIADRTNRINQVVGPISVTVGDAETPANDLVLSAVSSNPLLIQDISFGGSGANRTLTITPQPDQEGSTIIFVTATDAGGRSTTTSFSLVVLPLNTPPTLAAIPTQIVIANTVTNIPLTVSDLETAPENLIYTITSSNPDVVPASILQVVGTGSNMSIKATPTTNDLGSARITLVVSDGSLAVTNLFYLKVLQPEPIVFWNFNSIVPDSNAATGTFTPVSGSGIFTNIGSPTYTFGNIANTDTNTDECSIRLTAFPTQGTSNKTSGIEFRFSTVGYKNIAMAWDQQNSATASRYWRIQYTVDGVNFIDHTSYTNLTGGSTIQTGADFLGIAGANNNPNFGVRIVSEWESTLGGGSTNGFVGVSSGYGTGGTCWFDMITVTGEVMPLPPTLGVTKSGNNCVVSWPTSFAGYTLQGTTSLSSPNWQTVSEQVNQSNGQNVVTIPISGNARFFRLVQ